MKKLAVALLLAPLVALANDNAETSDVARGDREVNIPIPAGSVVVVRQQLGSGTPGFVGLEPATHLGQGIYHAPQYMPSYPTASALWPRVVDIKCVEEGKRFVCDGYNWLPGMGRGEYLFVRPVVQAAPKVIEKTVTVPVIVERKVFIEVPVKKKSE